MEPESLDDGAGRVSVPPGGIGSGVLRPRVVSTDVSGSSPLDPYVSVVLPSYNEQEHVVGRVSRVASQ